VPRERKPETIIRELKREMRIWKEQTVTNEDALQKARVTCRQHMETIGRLEAEVAEWKRRFELLLGSKEKRVGTLSIGPTPGEAEDMP